MTTFTGPFPAISLVPGDDWEEELTVKDSDGHAVDLSGSEWTYAKIEWFSGTKSLELTIDDTDAASGKLRFSADKSVTAALPMGQVSTITIKRADPSAFDETIYFAPVIGVRIKTTNTITVVMPGPQGAPGLSFRVVATEADFTADLGHDGDTGYAADTGAVYAKADGAWTATGAYIAVVGAGIVDHLDAIDTVAGSVSAVETAADNITAIQGAPAAATTATGAKTDAEAARDLSQKWAEGTLPGGAGTKSAKEWAGEAESSAETAADTVSDLTPRVTALEGMTPFTIDDAADLILPAPAGRMGVLLPATPIYGDGSLWRQFSDGSYLDGQLQALFGPTDNGFLFDNLTRQAYRDTDLTTLVSADGQAVAGLKDRSGKGNNATQATAASQATYKTGTVPYLSADGGDYYALQTFAWDSGAASFCFAVFDDAANGYIYAEGSSSTTVPLYAFSLISGALSAIIRNDLNGKLIDPLTAVSSVTLKADQWNICSVIDDGESISFRVNGEDGGSASYSRTGSSLTLDRATLAAVTRTTTDNFFTGSLIPGLSIGRALSAPEISAAEAAMAKIAGMTLS